MQSVTVLIIILVGIFLVDKQMLTVTNLIIIYMYRTNVYDLSLCYRSIKEYLNEYSIACKRIFEFMDNNKYIKETFGNKELKNASGKIEIKNLSFAYDKKKVLKDINLVINPNDTIGIVGESGSGKTTLLNLLSKSYKVDKNKILIDGIDINDLTRDSVRNNIAVISQNPYIFNLTIKENLELISDNITKKDIINACKVAQIHDYIMTLPDKYDTLLGEGGTNLSGGQKQRLAIARALLKKSKIILFDEATSALDNVTQNELQKSINNISDDFTIIIVAHRLSTIKDCNKIYVMEKGEIVGAGTHEEMLKNNLKYKKLYNE
jgi:ATP-binding cassette subfamily B protein